MLYDRVLVLTIRSKVTKIDLMIGVVFQNDLNNKRF